MKFVVHFVGYTCGNWMFCAQLFQRHKILLQ